MTTESLETLVEKLSNLTVLELSQLKKLLEEKWDVTASAPVVAVAAGGGGEAPVAAEPTEFAVTLEDVPADKKIGVLKVVREVTGLALKEAKEMTEGLPKTVKEKTSKSDAEDTVKKLQDAGAKASFKGL
ncbi:ribosomal protein L7/L12 [Chlamydia pneumoniae TW-183]|uniref:Large ribosomal subunit protein bL12 n=2 Tax=Chlamydia pneumoniae TaxID=83558 RepID=RL7_CHLPN|nr:50S ribosomal protein L7/L12 [Chlamydia pneumoniae]Q9Z9A1.3 RecName: Full=Large ribosomal subunit protein bL12; AltName: Full=50S ribosomal protein L7/L12 [Chlamydia pneumoniae]AAD18233.1 L7/L12 Ribosomal Protein [Chlamydia pneumoniae CWL029]AAF38503.1 ribosomal protein L7/L12 [Chlamydia pneumoniae AR39]AAP98013.1 ribosomal protein L7/L12 [Chlamydia pneumoniae TW-183]ACZ33059.1 ribosomal protein L7/L12 [Chlamydia pneumoniae LPCoLN]ETR79951.1 LSU ribosomal protein L7/L12 (P1/P2) [Chlamydia 